MNKRLLLLNDTNNQSLVLSSWVRAHLGKITFLLGILFFSSYGFSQSSAPAGVNLGALELWVDGSDPENDGVAPASGSIVVWNDKSGNGSDLSVPGSPGTPGDPYYEQSIPEFNGAGGFVFDSTDIFRFDVGDWTGDHTIFIVFAQDTAVTTPGTALFSSGDGLNAQFEIQVDAGLNNYTYHTTSGAGGSTITESIFGPQSAALGMSRMYSATRSMDSITCFVNGAFVSGMTATTGDEFDEYVLNTNREENVGNNCKVAEVIIYSTVLTPNEMARVNNYLACKYNLPIATVTPGGIDPCDVALWMKADAGLDTTGVDVDAWLDQSPSGLSGAPENSGEEPTFSAADNNFNPSLSFDPLSNDALFLGTASNNGLNMAAGDFSLYTVAFVDDNIDGVLYADRYCLEENGFMMQFNSATKTWEFEGGDASGSTYDSNDSVNVATANTLTNYSLVSMKRSGNNYSIKTNEGNEDTGMTNTTVNYNSTSTDRWIGRQKDSPCNVDYFDGNISEIIAVKANLTANEDIQIRSYLALKYGLSLDPLIVNYLSSNGTAIWDNTISSYWNDVAGIGRDDGSMLNQKISKSQNEKAIVTISTDLDFSTPNTDASRTSLSDGQFLIWGNDNDLASGGWTTVQAPPGYAVLPQAWLVQETGSPGNVSVQVHVDNLSNDIPDFFGSLYLSHGPNPSATTPIEMTLDSTGYWSVSGINFADDDFFTFAVKNELFVEFSSSFSNSIDETYLGASFPTVVDSGIVNIPTWYAVTTSTTGTGAGFATQGDDYNFDNDTITVVAGDYSILTTTMFDTTGMLIDDSDIEGAEEVEFSFITTEVAVSTGDADNSGGTADEHELTITDDDAYNVSIEKLTDGIENDPTMGDATFRIYLVGGANSATVTGDVSWSTGSATGGAPNPGVTDFDDGVSNFTFNPGDTEVIINLETGQANYDDALLEGTETIIGVLSNVTSSTGQAVIANATDTAFITDDEVTGILISIDTVSGFGITEEGSPNSLRFRVSIDGGVANNSGVPIEGTVTYTASSATEGAGNDFLSVTTFSILDGNNSTTLNINALSDVLVENTETVVPEITITSGPGTVNPSGNTATAFITDEDTTGLTISITAVGSVTGVTEGAVPTIDYVVSLDNSKINGTGSDIVGTISLYSNNGTATNFVDYNASGVTDFAIPDGMNSGIYSIILVDDMISETTDSLTAEIVSTGIGSPSTSNSVDLAIFDDDSGLTVIEIGSPTDTTESISGTPFVSFEVSIVAGGAAASDLTGTISYGTGPGTATAGSDFVPETTYTIPAGDTTVTVEVYVINDSSIESDENVVANLTGAAPLGNYGNSSSTAVIFDDDGANLSIVVDTVMSGAEGGSDAQFVISILGSIPNGSGSPITGNLTYGGTASSSDFSAVTNYEIAIGESSDTIDVIIDDDDLLEYTDTLYCILDTNSLSLGSVLVDSAFALIYDNDLDSLSISIQSPVDGAEGGGDVSFTIAIDNGYVNGLGVPLTGDLIFNGTAVATDDFNNFDTYSIPDGSTFVIRDLPVINDQSLEQQESVIATLSNPLIPGTHNPNFSTDTAYIDDNDLANAALQITASNGVEMPTPHNPIFIVSFVGGLQNETGSPITGTITLAGTATEGAANDYIGAVTFAIQNDSIQQRIPFVVQDDLLEESNETIVATISNPSPGIIGVSTTNNTATAIIFDDDTDIDNDGLSDLVDPIVGNIDSDCDGIFDGCDADADGDGLLDDGGIDLTNNGTNNVFYELYCIDTDLDGIKDTCDADSDGDGIIENGPDVNSDELNDNHWPVADLDEDLLPDHVDPNDNNIDSDGDGITDGADADVNGDGILDNGCDDDGDGISNKADIDFNPSSVDNDNDGIIAEWDMNDITYDGQQINYIVSPNGDGVNETLVIAGIQVLDEHLLTIYNRYGEPVYTDDEYNNLWEGEVNVESSMGTDKLSDGVYYYTLEVGDDARAVRGYIEIRH